MSCSGPCNRAADSPPRPGLSHPGIRSPQFCHTSVSSIGQHLSTDSDDDQFTMGAEPPRPADVHHEARLLRFLRNLAATWMGPEPFNHDEDIAALSWRERCVSYVLRRLAEPHFARL
eukprot:6297603-Pyramimonas_sp.AAC.1